MIDVNEHAAYLLTAFFAEKRRHAARDAPTGVIFLAVRTDDPRSGGGVLITRTGSDCPTAQIQAAIWQERN